MKKWVCSWFGERGADNSWIVVDNRMEERGADYTLIPSELKLFLKASPNHKWTPAVTMKYSERFTPKEFWVLGQTITDRLNAMEVEKKLKGDG